MTSSAPRARGFTLLELVVVLGIFAMMSMMAYGGLANALTARTHIAQSLERTAALQKAYLRLRNDFQQLRQRPARDGFGDPQPSLLVTPDDAVEFTRSGWRNPLSQPRSVLERVAYRYDDRKQQLVRASWRVLDRAQDSEPAEVVVLEQVRAAEWRFLDSKLEWHPRWPAVATAGPQTDSVPLAVELTVELADAGELRFLFSATNDTRTSGPAPGSGRNP